MQDDFTETSVRDEFTRSGLLTRFGRAAAGAALIGGAAGLPGATNAWAATPKRGGTLEVSVTDSSTTDSLDPAKPINTHDVLALGMIFDGLTRLDLKFKVYPGLAESWDSDKLGKVWEFRLRKGVTFHNGKTLTAEDVAWSMRRATDPKGIGTGVAELNPYLLPAGIKVVNPTTVRFTLKQPNFFWPAFLGFFFTNIGQKGTTKWNKPAGTGPFMVETFQPGGDFLAKRNPNYWDHGQPYLDAVRLVNVYDQGTKVETVLSGSAHLGDTMVPKYIPQVKSSGVADLVTGKGGAMIVNGFQGDKKPFSDPAVRKALKLVVDRQQMVDQIYYGHASVTPDIPIPPSDPLFPAGLKPPARDPEQAKSILKKAGYDKLTYTTNTSAWYPGPSEEAVLFKQQAADGGIEVDIKVWQTQTYLSRVLYHVPAFMDAWLRQQALMLGPLLYTPGSAFNETHVNNPQIPKLFASAASSSDPAKQRARVADACALIASDSAQVIPCHVDIFWPKKKNLQGIQPNWATLMTLRTAYLA